MSGLLDEQQAAATEARRPRRRWLWAAGLAGLAAVAFALFWFQPHKLFIDERVDEAIPTVAGEPSRPSGSATTEPAPGSGSPSATTATEEPVGVARGQFVSLDHGTTGLVRVLELPDGGRIVRLEGLDTSNGPDLFVYLTATPADGGEASFDDDYVNLGRLKGNQGDQNYDVPADTDLTRLATVVIWCDRFDSAFGAADLTGVT